MVVVPVAMPVTMPVLATVSIPVAVLLHTPPPAASLRFVADPTHTVAVPFIVPAVTAGSTETTYVALVLPQPLVRV